VGGASAATIDGNITANQSIMRLASGLAAMAGGHRDDAAHRRCRRRRCGHCR
jgi:hypothetical protein